MPPRKPRSPGTLRGISISLTCVAVAFQLTAWLLFAVGLVIQNGPGTGMSADMEQYGDNPLLWVLGIFFVLLAMFAPFLGALMGIGLGIGAIITARKARSKSALVCAIVVTSLSAIGIIAGPLLANQL